VNKQPMTPMKLRLMTYLASALLMSQRQPRWKRSS